ncbi:glucan endo-1,3-beta-glucosidase 4-like protein, partial [Tanacetum coccineum]
MILITRCQAQCVCSSSFSHHSEFFCSVFETAIPKDTPIELPLGTSGDATVNASGGFCVERKGADTSSLQDGSNWACGPGQANCSAIQSGQPCFMPDTLENHASFAPNDYYQRTRSVGATCDFS